MKNLLTIIPTSLILLIITFFLNNYLLINLSIYFKLIEIISLNPSITNYIKCPKKTLSNFFLMQILIKKTLPISPVPSCRTIGEGVDTKNANMIIPGRGGKVGDAYNNNYVQ